jgi:hypothetical protein
LNKFKKLLPPLPDHKPSATLPAGTGTHLLALINLWQDNGMFLNSSFAVMVNF